MFSAVLGILAGAFLHVFFKFMESYQKTDRIMSFGTGKPQKEWNINV